MQPLMSCFATGFTRRARAACALVLFAAAGGVLAQVQTTASFGGPPETIGNMGLDADAYVQVEGRGLLQDLDLRFEALAGCDATPGNPAAAITHTAVGQLTIRLTSPAGTPVVVYAQRGGTRENICDLLLDDDGAHPALSTLSGASGSAVSGTFLPEAPLAGFDGEDPNGTWRLDVIDDAAGDDGTLNRFSLLLLTAPVPEIVVDVLDDPFPGGCSPGSCSLREAVATANARAGLDRIVLPAGTLQLTRAGSGEDGNLSGDLDVLDRLEIVGQGAAATTVAQAAADRLLHVAGAGSVRIAGLRLQGGHGVDAGGALSGNGVVRIEDAELLGNSALRYGGAIHHTGGGNAGVPPQLVLQRVRFSDNHASNITAAEAFGGALYSFSSGFPAEYARIEDCTFEGNTADNGGGALAFDAVQSLSSIPVSVRRSSFTDNHVTIAGPGGALATNVDQNGVVRLTIEDSVFEQNTVPSAPGNGNDGGAISMHSGELERMLRTILSDNAAHRGGAIATSSGSAAIEDSTLCGNLAVAAGGGLVASGPLTLLASTFCDNEVSTASTADTGGGAIAASFGGVTIARSTFDGNSALRGGAIALIGGDLDMRSNTLVAPATLPPGATASLLRYDETLATRALTLHNNILIGRCTWAGAAIVPDFAFHNIEASGNTCRLTQAEVALDNQIATAGAQINLGPLADNGGPTPTRLPQAPSIAIDAGFTLLCTAADQRGYEGTDAVCDIGAVEASGMPLPDAIFENGFEGA